MNGDTIRLAILDVDGCLTPGEAQPWDFDVLAYVRALNRRARTGEPVPAVTLCTGRQEPYVEVLMQAIDAYLPGIFENGCGLYFPDGYRFVLHPSISTEARQALFRARSTLQREVADARLGYFQPGKEASLTLYPLPGITVRALYRAIQAVLGNERDLFTLRESASCVDLTPHGVDKGAGVRWLSEETGIPLAQMGGVGDSTSDLEFLRLVGRSAAPANATGPVRAAVEYVSPHADGQGVVDILEHWTR